MRSRTDIFAIALSSTLTAALAFVALYPAGAQKAPESILPPGFGQPEPPPASAPPRAASPEPKPADQVPDYALTVPSDGNVQGLVAENTANALDNALTAAVAPMDLPPEARRGLDRVGLIPAAEGGMAANAFGNADGHFLTTIMQRTRAPVASRWGSILLRRALLSQTAIPVNVDGADWVAARAWLLVRMGEANNARSLVQRVDAENYTPWLNAVAMQAALATGDPGMLCGIADAAALTSDEPSWPLARAMCAGLSGEGGTASALVDQARATRRTGGIDVLLAEKVVGVGSNTRRAITIQWDGVERLTAWRYGLATATGVAIPDALLATAGPQVRAWQASAPLLTADARAPSADRAAILGVFSNAALVDLYSTIYDDTDPSDRSGTTAANLRAAYTGDPAARITGLKDLWGNGANSLQHYARLILGARAAAMIAPADGTVDSDAIVAAMFSAGFDIQAERWYGNVGSGSLGWGLLAVGTPRPPFRIGGGELGSFRSAGGDAGALRAQFLFAGLAGLGRLPSGQIEQLARDYEVPVGRQSAWTRALDQAVRAGQPGTVALLCAAGMQTPLWHDVPPAHLYHIVASLRAVGLEPEARMIAAEALTRS